MEFEKKKTLFLIFNRLNENDLFSLFTKQEKMNKSWRYYIYHSTPAKKKKKYRYL